MNTPGYWKPDTLAARSKAGEALDEYLRLAWRDASGAADKADWSEDQLKASDLSSTHLMRWVAIGAYEPILVDPSAKEESMFISADSGVSSDVATGLLAMAADNY